MKTFRKLLVFAGILGILVLVAAPVRADWDPSMPTKWVQPPDLTQYGMDVNATFVQQAGTTTGIWPYVKILADDFPCNTTGPITDIHIWGSWLFDEVEPGTTFKLSIHDDVPESDTNPYSYPGDELWREFFLPGEYVANPLSTTVTEQFYDPNQDEIIGFDNQVWQYNFFPDNPFVQEGTAADPKIYWLDVQALVPLTSGADQKVFGWKTSFPGWNDDATFADTASFGGTLTTPWTDMHYPLGHFYEGRSIDMAFAITPEPGTMFMILTGATTALVAGAWQRRRRTT